MSLISVKFHSCANRLSLLVSRVGLQKTSRNYSFKTIGFCPRTKVKSPLILRRFYATWPRVLFYSLPQSVSLSFRRVGKERVNEVVFSAALELNLVKYFPILQKTAIEQSPQTNTAT